MSSIRVVYDDREKFPWIVMCKGFIWCKCREKSHADAIVRKLQHVVNLYNEN